MTKKGAALLGAVLLSLVIPGAGWAQEVKREGLNRLFVRSSSMGIGLRPFQYADNTREMVVIAGTGVDYSLRFHPNFYFEAGVFRGSPVGLSIDTSISSDEVPVSGDYFSVSAGGGILFQFPKGVLEQMDFSIGLELFNGTLKYEFTDPVVNPGVSGERTLSLFGLLAGMRANLWLSGVGLSLGIKQSYFAIPGGSRIEEYSSNGFDQRLVSVFLIELGMGMDF